ncbi:hypothetical protein [Tropicimonas sp. S265A]|uniref:hypothetical protein n=1 Tax=Tropicimonas sp. S265A TaxID=3415134 RepID=UPI003C7AD7C6
MKKIDSKVAVRPNAGQRSFPEGTVKGYTWIPTVLEDLRDFAQAHDYSEIAAEVEKCLSEVQRINTEQSAKHRKRLN